MKKWERPGNKVELCSFIPEFLFIITEFGLQTNYKFVLIDS